MARKNQIRTALNTKVHRKCTIGNILQNREAFFISVDRNVFQNLIYPILSWREKNHYI